MRDSRLKVRHRRGRCDPENPLIRRGRGPGRVWRAKLERVRLELRGTELAKFLGLGAFRTQAQEAAFERVSETCADQEDGDDNDGNA